MPGCTPTPQAHSEKNLLHEEAMQCNAMQWIMQRGAAMLSFHCELFPIAIGSQ
jgi:hypothetical protein